MGNLFDRLFGQQQTPATDDLGVVVPSQGGGLFGNAFGDYDLGSRLMMAGSFLDGQPGAAQQIAQQMERRKIAKQVAKQRYEAARTILSKRKDLVPLYNADPEGFMTYYTKMTFDDMVQAKESEREAARHVRDRAEAVQDTIDRYAHEDKSQQAGFAHSDASNLQQQQFQTQFQQQGANVELEKQKALKRFDQVMDPDAQAHRGLMDAIQERANKIQAPGAGVFYNAPDLPTLAARQVLGNPKLSQFDASQLMMNAKPSEGMKEVRISQDAQQGAKIQEWQQALAVGAIPPGTPFTDYLGMIGKGGTGGQPKVTEQELRNISIEAGSRSSNNLSLDDLKAMREHSVALQAKRSGIPMMDQISQKFLPDDVQVSDLKLNTIATLNTLAVSGAAFSQNEITDKLKRLYPLSADSDKAVSQRYALYQDMLQTIWQAAKTGLDKQGKPLPPEFYSQLQQLGPSPTPTFSDAEKAKLKSQGLLP